MTGFTVIELPRALEPVTEDPFLDGLGAAIAELPDRSRSRRSGEGLQDIYVPRAIARAA